LTILTELYCDDLDIIQYKDKIEKIVINIY
jgi:hypothetical protein